MSPLGIGADVQQHVAVAAGAADDHHAGRFPPASRRRSPPPQAQWPRAETVMHDSQGRFIWNPPMCCSGVS